MKNAFTKLEYTRVQLDTSVWVVNGRTGMEQYWCGYVIGVDT